MEISEARRTGFHHGGDDDGGADIDPTGPAGPEGQVLQGGWAAME